jgi:hypothetical protein
MLFDNKYIVIFIIVILLKPRNLIKFYFYQKDELEIKTTKFDK